MVVPGQRSPVRPGPDGRLGPGARRDWRRSASAAWSPATRASEADFDTWHWVARQPMATYLNFVSIGQYELEAGVVDGRPYVYAVTEQLDAGDRQSVLTVAAPVRARSSAGWSACSARTRSPRSAGSSPAHELDFAGWRPRPDRSTTRRPSATPTSSTTCWCTNWPTCGSATRSRCGSGTTSSSTRVTPSWAQWGYAERAARSPIAATNGSTTPTKTPLADRRVLAGDHDRSRVASSCSPPCTPADRWCCRRSAT